MIGMFIIWFLDLPKLIMKVLLGMMMRFIHDLPVKMLMAILMTMGSDRTIRIGDTGRLFFHWFHPEKF